ncbi:MAG: TonB-dependent receptor [Gemmatimonadota bacterium]|nr:MAG: TonB-dependent receptor [Gemmatimonadota bacterium]
MGGAFSPAIGARRHVEPSRPLAASLIFLILLSGQTPALAQVGSLGGRVVDAESGQPLIGATVALIAGAGRTVRTATASANGEFVLTGVEPGRYSLVCSALGFEERRLDGVRVGDSPVALGDVALVSVAFRLNPIVVTVSREREKALESPASVHTIDREAIQERPSTTAVDHVVGTPGTDVVTTGLSQHNVASRGFNGVFSASLFVLTDNRWAAVPSLRFNAYNLIPTTNEDIDRIEFVLGPGSALYGPNVDKGVMHIITRSPLDHQESSVSVMGGERSVFQGSFRQAGTFSRTVGYKLSGLYFQGDDWKFDDPTEIVARDFDQERFQGDGRVDLRLGERGILTLNGGASQLARAIELTQIGAVQANGWTYSYLQGRYRRGGLFAQAYINLSDAGDTYTLREGDTITDNSLLYVGQIQHGVSPGERQRFTYGADLIRTIPRTDGAIMGRNEDSDAITELGAYLQSETQLSPRIDLILAGRLDYHSAIDDLVFSPRIAFVYNPRPEHRFRLTYNRALRQPETNQLFIDRLSASDLGGLPFPVRARGTPESGFTFRRDCVDSLDRTGLCMRSPFAPAVLGQPTITSLPLDATLLWDAVVGIIAAEDPQVGELLSLMAQPDAGDVSTVLKRLNPSTGGFDPVSEVLDIEPAGSQISNTFEFGYKGLIGDRLLLGVDVWYTRFQDFLGPLLVETPSAFMDTNSLRDYLLAEAQRLNLPIDQPTAAFLAATMSGIPVATVTPEQVEDSDAADILLTYRTFPDFDLWGADFGLTLELSNRFALTGVYSLLSDNFLSAADLGDQADLALNAPRNKASLSGRYGNERLGLKAELRGRWVEGFPVASGVYVGRVKSYAVVDAQISYALPISRSTEISLSAANLLTFYENPDGERVNVFSGRHQEMVGAPMLGRLLMLRLRHSF